jgi:hypothetical protein
MIPCMRCGMESKITYTLSLANLNQESEKQVIQKFFAKNVQI